MTSPASTAPVPVTGRGAGRGTALIVVASFSCLVVALQQTLVVPAVPVLPGVLGTSAGAVSWLVTATLLTGAVATPIIAKLSDTYGRRRMLVVSMAFVLVGSLLAPLAGITTLIIGRALQGLGTALVPVAMAQMRDSLPPRRVGTALAILSATLGVGGGIGVPLGGVVLQAWGWQWLFWISAALSVISIVLIAAVMPAHDPQRTSRFDLLGAVLLSIALLAVLMAVSQGGTWGWTNPATIICAVVGVIALLAFGRSQVTAADPIVDLHSTASAPILFTNVASLILGVLMFANLLVTTLQLQGSPSEHGFGWSAAAAGLAMLPNAAAMFAVAPFTAWLAGKWGPRTVLAVGGAVTAAGYLLRVLASPGAGWVIVWATVIGVGVGIGYAALPMLIVAYAPASEIGAANGVNALVRAIGTSIASAGVAAVTAVMAVEVTGVSVPAAGAYTAIGLAATVGGVLTMLCAVLARTRTVAGGSQA